MQEATEITVNYRGRNTVIEACPEKGPGVSKIERELQQPDEMTSTPPLPYNDWSADLLADYIFNIHHAYIRRNLPVIMAYACKLNRAHGEDHPELRTIKRLADEFSSVLTAHLAKEEGILFPYIKELVRARKSGPHPKHFKTMHQPVRVMEMEHESMVELIHRIVRLCNDHALPKDACATYTVFYKMLAEFECDLDVHIHLENNILFLKRIQLEEHLNNYS